MVSKNEPIVHPELVSPQNMLVSEEELPISDPELLLKVPASEVIKEVSPAQPEVIKEVSPAQPIACVPIFKNKAYPMFTDYLDSLQKITVDFNFKHSRLRNKNKRKPNQSINFNRNRIILIERDILCSLSELVKNHYVYDSDDEEEEEESANKVMNDFKEHLNNAFKSSDPMEYFERKSEENMDFLLSNKGESKHEALYQTFFGYAWLYSLIIQLDDNLTFTHQRRFRQKNFLWNFLLSRKENLKDFCIEDIEKWQQCLQKSFVTVEQWKLDEAKKIESLLWNEIDRSHFQTKDLIEQNTDIIGEEKYKEFNKQLESLNINNDIDELEKDIEKLQQFSTDLKSIGNDVTTLIETITEQKGNKTESENNDEDNDSSNEDNEDNDSSNEDNEDKDSSNEDNEDKDSS